MLETEQVCGSGYRSSRISQCAFDHRSFTIVYVLFE